MAQPGPARPMPFLGPDQIRRFIENIENIVGPSTGEIRMEIPAVVRRSDPDAVAPSAPASPRRVSGTLIDHTDDNPWGDVESPGITTQAQAARQASYRAALEDDAFTMRFPEDPPPGLRDPRRDRDRQTSRSQSDGRSRIEFERNLERREIMVRVDLPPQGVRMAIPWDDFENGNGQRPDLDHLSRVLPDLIERAVHNAVETAILEAVRFPSRDPSRDRAPDRVGFNSRAREGLVRTNGEIGSSGSVGGNGGNGGSNWGMSGNLTDDQASRLREVLTQSGVTHQEFDSALSALRQAGFDPNRSPGSQVREQLLASLEETPARPLVPGQGHARTRAALIALDLTETPDANDGQAESSPAAASRRILED